MHDLLAALATPIVAAPMAGGPSTPSLVTAVTAAGGLGFLAAGYKTPEALAEQIEQVRALRRPFGVNLFVPSAHPVDNDAFAAYADELHSEAAAFGLTLDSTPRFDDDHWAAKLDLLEAHPVPLVSFTFGLPTSDEVARLRKVGTRTAATVTRVDEALAARDVGVDGLVVQGAGAGGHSATHDPTREPDTPALDLVTQVRSVTEVPIIAAGGVDGPEAVRALREAGAAAVAVGTLLLLTDEAGTSAVHRAALLDPAFERTAITRAFTGRPARALVNGFMQRHQGLTAYPAVHHLTRELRAAASAAGDADRAHLWAGTGYRNARTGPAADVVRWCAAATATG